MVVKNLLLTTEKGLGKGETPIFPISVFRLKKEINLDPDSPNYDLFKLACRVSAKRLYPNFVNQCAPFNMQYYEADKPETHISTMGCRTRVIGNTYDPSQQITHGRGNLSFTSINLPRLAIESKGNIDLFFEKLDKMMILCINQLLHRFEIQCSKKTYNYPFLMEQGVWLDSDKLEGEDISEVLKHGTLSIGFIGLAETLTSLIGKHHGESEEAQELGLKIIKFMRNKMDKEAQERKLNFSLIATPAEGLSGRFVKLDKKKYGIIENVTDKDYYVNSNHVPPAYNISAFDKMRIEAPYHELTNAGHISYVEVDGDISKNLDAFEKLVREGHKQNLGYFAISHPIDRCGGRGSCGYTGTMDEDLCPVCENTEIERIRRIN